MSRDRSVVAFFLVSLSLLVLFQLGLHRSYTQPYPPLAISLSSSATRLVDFVGIALGLRRLSADIAWIETLAYYGTREEGQTEFEFENGIGRYPHFLPLAQRVARIDPYFTYVYFYAGGVLGWNLNRLDEAEELLRMGIQNNPKEWRLQQYLAGLAFQKNHDISKLSEFLEAFLMQPDCPNILRSILANIYKKQHRYRDALRVWFVVLDSNDPAYRPRALHQIQELGPLSGLPSGAS